MNWGLVSLGALMVAACAARGQVNVAAQPPNAAPPASAPSMSSAPLPPPVLSPANVQLTAQAATVNGQPVAFDGVAEGLEWPALARAFAANRPSPIVVDVARDVPVAMVLRAAFTLRQSDLRVQTPDDHGVTRPVDLKAKPTAAPTSEKKCHLAVFLTAGGGLHVAMPGGAQEYSDAESFARALDAARIECPLRYVAFGAASGEQPWGGVFDLMSVVQRFGGGGGARFVLADAVRPPVREQPAKRDNGDAGEKR